MEKYFDAAWLVIIFTLFLSHSIPIAWAIFHPVVTVTIVFFNIAYVVHILKRYIL